ncbi:hypothetical protein [Cohnella rhizosphaerae]|uniref:GLAA-B beta-barrel domain-containing protein n=1 Tax=Cohnella rhizosphaerae TaxID=1457232 RepID=A0A9X4KT90_9BACL|nr:hypothetical protein [Cohnella rhizosphaerae]MDG0809806.1 hypothetical protein [Cohnella rhizosphaerae]
MIIRMEQFGAKPEQGFDNTLAVRSALDSCREIEGAVLVFPRGNYHFWPDKAVEKQLFISNHDQAGLRRIAFHLADRSGFTVDGQGSEFIFHGPMIPFVIENCSKVLVRNLVIDWEEPMFAQGTVSRADHESFDIQMPEGTDYKVEDHAVWFTFGGIPEKVWGLNEFDKQTKAPAYQSGDQLSWGNYSKVRVEQSRPGVITYQGDNMKLPRIGNVIVMRFGRRENPAFFHQRRGKRQLGIRERASCTGHGTPCAMVFEYTLAPIQRHAQTRVGPYGNRHRGCHALRILSRPGDA